MILQYLLGTSGMILPLLCFSPFLIFYLRFLLEKIQVCHRNTDSCREKYSQGSQRMRDFALIKPSWIYTQMLLVLNDHYHGLGFCQSLCMAHNNTVQMFLLLNCILECTKIVIPNAGECESIHMHACYCFSEICKAGNRVWFQWICIAIWSCNSNVLSSKSQLKENILSIIWEKMILIYLTRLL